MSPYKFRIGQRVMIVAQQSSGVIFATSRAYMERVNRYVVKVDHDQPLVTVNGTYTAFEHELKEINDETQRAEL